MCDGLELAVLRRTVAEYGSQLAELTVDLGVARQQHEADHAARDALYRAVQVAGLDPEELLVRRAQALRDVAAGGGFDGADEEVTADGTTAS